MWSRSECRKYLRRYGAFLVGQVDVAKVLREFHGDRLHGRGSSTMYDAFVYQHHADQPSHL